MHEYDKNFAGNSDSMFSKHLENKTHYRGAQHEMMQMKASKAANLVISEEPEHLPLRYGFV